MAESLVWAPQRLWASRAQAPGLPAVATLSRPRLPAGSPAWPEHSPHLRLLGDTVAGLPLEHLPQWWTLTYLTSVFPLTPCRDSSVSGLVLWGSEAHWPAALWTSVHSSSCGPSFSSRTLCPGFQPSGLFQEWSIFPQAASPGPQAAATCCCLGSCQSSRLSGEGSQLRIPGLRQSVELCAF